MSDLISRQAAIDAVCTHGTELERRGITVLAVVNHKQVTVDLLEQLPSAEPEQKHGRWEQVEVSYLADADAEIKESMAIASMFCPVCKRYHNEVYLYGNPTYGVNYCPNCGCAMTKDGDSDDDQS